MTTLTAEKPRLRGLLHLVAFPFWIVLGAVLVVLGGAARAALTVYALSIAGLFGVSALYHRVQWTTARARQRLRRLDHSMIFLAIAGTYTALCALALPSRLAVPVLAFVWAFTIVGIGIRMSSIRASKRAAVIPYLILGWVAVAVMPSLLEELGVAGVGLLALGGLFYTLGALTFARQRPDPIPGVFGYHEVFHAFVIAGALAHYAVVAFFALPGA